FFGPNLVSPGSCCNCFMQRCQAPPEWVVVPGVVAISPEEGCFQFRLSPPLLGCQACEIRFRWPPVKASKINDLDSAPVVNQPVSRLPIPVTGHRRHQPRRVGGKYSLRRVLLLGINAVPAGK